MDCGMKRLSGLGYYIEAKWTEVCRGWVVVWGIKPATCG